MRPRKKAEAKKHNQSHERRFKTIGKGYNAMPENYYAMRKLVDEQQKLDKLAKLAASTGEPIFTASQDSEFVELMPGNYQRVDGSVGKVDFIEDAEFEVIGD